MEGSVLTQAPGFKGFSRTEKTTTSQYITKKQKHDLESTLMCKKFT